MPFYTGPNKITLKDFWQLVWQNKVGKIVMLTNLVEEGKVYKVAAIFGATFNTICRLLNISKSLWLRSQYNGGAAWLVNITP